MKTLFTCLVVVLLAALCFAADEYVVQKGDVLYTLEGDYSGRPWQWGRLVELNPFLKVPGRTWVDEKGRTIVLIRPGEELRGLKELGIVPQPFPIERLKVEDSSALVPVPVPHGHSWFWWLLLILSGLAIIAAIVALIRIRRNPVTAGNPVVSGGVTDRTAAGQFRENIAQTTGVPTDRIEIHNLVRGRMYGVVNVRYRDGQSRRMLLVGQIGYRAMVRRNGGPWTEEYMLQACGNDLSMSGARYVPGFGFRFVPEVAVEETPRPAPVQSTPTPASTPAAEGEKHFTFRPAGGGRPNMADFEGFASFDVEVRDGKTTVRFS